MPVGGFVVKFGLVAGLFGVALFCGVAPVLPEFVVPLLNVDVPVPPVPRRVPVFGLLVPVPVLPSLPVPVGLEGCVRLLVLAGFPVLPLALLLALPCVLAATSAGTEMMISR